jgi:hypothetical protein
MLALSFKIFGCVAVVVIAIIAWAFLTNDWSK